VYENGMNLPLIFYGAKKERETEYTHKQPLLYSNIHMNSEYYPRLHTNKNRLSTSPAKRSARAEAQRAETVFTT